MGSNKDLLNLLKEWEVVDAFQNLKEHGVTYKRLAYLSSEDIKDLFPSDIGLRAEFREKCFNWKNSLVDSAASNPNESKQLAKVSNGVKRKSSHNLSSPKKPKNTYYMSQRESNGSNAAKGKLYSNNSKLNIVSRTKRQLSQSPHSIRPSSSVSDKTLINESSAAVAAANEECKLKKSEMTNGITPDLPKAQKLWMETYDFRRNFILNQTSTINDILNEWIYYKSNQAEEFISFDFDLLYPKKGENLITGWAAFVQKMTTHLNANPIKDKQCIQLYMDFKEENISRDSCDLILTLLLNAILKPTVRIRVKNHQSSTSTPTNEKYYYHPTIKDAQDSMIIVVPSMSEFETVKECKRLKSLEIETKIQPYIVVIGDDKLNLKEFYVCVEGTLLKCSTFIKALDTCLKSFFVFELQYPIESSFVWLFLQKHFYQIDTEYDKKSPAVTELMQSLNCTDS